MQEIKNNRHSTKITRFLQENQVNQLQNSDVFGQVVTYILITFGIIFLILSLLLLFLKLFYNLSLSEPADTK